LAASKSLIMRRIAFKCGWHDPNYGWRGIKSLMLQPILRSQTIIYKASLFISFLHIWHWHIYPN